MCVCIRLFNVQSLVSFSFAENLKFSFVSGFLMNDFDENGNDPFNVERIYIDRYCWSLAVGHATFVKFPNVLSLHRVRLPKSENWPVQRKLDRNQFIFGCYTAK